MQGADTAWILTSTALVLFMTLPGLALFYAGLVRSQNVLSVLMNCFAIAATVSILWFAVGYSIAFGDGNAWWGGLGKSFLSGVDIDSVSGTIPETLFFMFQMTFAIITPALIVGAYPERIHFSFVIAFSLVWVLIVYAPVVHWVWGGGFLAEMGLLDFAGGVVVHVTAGVSALVLAMMLGPRRGFPGEVQPPHSPGLTMIGAAMLWVGWFGFNAGSALAADAAAGMAMTVTHIAAASGAIAWSVMELIRYRKASLIGAVTGMVAGLATITPASGSVGPVGGLVLGLAGGVVCYMVTQLIKQRFKIDDSLDVFAVHGVGGMLGTMLTAVFVSVVLGGNGLAEGMTIGSQLGVQALGIIIVAVWSGVLTAIIVMVLKMFLTFRVDEETEVQGLDLALHGERGYHNM
ncbi:MAG: ammonium transporter [Rhodospirillaceae bacterium]|jgi:Amt family ammonium transporter|nr:ammonium transporter [Rhodospirillaceae bacterium]MBT4771187.1 ammonium transporter [Rhodospirillaceae bacterium]MBT5357810.1 ammonium transporter [Rhodospirillaceae bacterium]MBT5770117.1 ammonium transporter [Rhodospirillaceae bacterium]MBT6310901.1 ammonium transporter [Rhodospirillaceae bacterium]